MEKDVGYHEKRGFNSFKPYATFILAGMNAAVFALGYILVFLGYGDVLTLLGAKINVLIAAGQYWRLLTPVLLHAGVEHLLSNSIGLLIWGKQVEYILGRTRFIIIYVVAGICGSLLSFAFSDSMSVGASGSIFGLFGVFLYLLRTRRNLFSGPMAIQVLIIIGINLASGFMNPQVDNLGHLGGLIGGYLCAWAVGLREDRHIDPLRVLFTVLLLVFMLLTFCYGVGRYGWF